MTPRQQSILIGAVVTGILSTSYLGFLNLLCCLGVIVGGMVASQQYVGRTGGTIQAGDGAVLGALAGAGGAVLSAVFDRALRPFNLDSQSITEGLREQLMQNMGSGQGMSPEMMQQLQGEGSGMLTAVGLFSLVVNVVFFAIFGAIGGALGTALFGEERTDGEGGVRTAETEIVDE